MGHWMSDFEDAVDWPANACDAWEVAFDDGDVICLSLSAPRRGRRATDGNWWPEKV